MTTDKIKLNLRPIRVTEGSRGSVEKRESGDDLMIDV